VLPQNFISLSLLLSELFIDFCYLLSMFQKTANCSYSLLQYKGTITVLYNYFANQHYIQFQLSNIRHQLSATIGIKNTSRPPFMSSNVHVTV